MDGGSHHGGGLDTDHHPLEGGCVVGGRDVGLDNVAPVKAKCISGAPMMEVASIQVLLTSGE